MNGSPNRIYNNGIEAQDLSRDKTHVPSKMSLTRFYTDNKFGLFINLRSMTDTSMYVRVVRLVNTKDGGFLEIDRKTSGSGNGKCHVFTTSNCQMNIMDKQLQSVQY